MMWTEYLVWVAIVLFAALSFLFAIAETALFALGKWKALGLAERHGPRGERVVHLLKEPQDLLATIVLANTFANAGLVITALWQASSGSWPLLATAAGTVVLVLFGCEVLPKTLAVRNPEKWALRVGGLIERLQRTTGVLRRLAQWMNAGILRTMVPKSVKPQTTLTDAEYHELLELAYQQGTLAESEKEIILQIIQLDQKTAKDVMRPRAQMVSASDDLSVEAMAEVARKHRLIRLPLYDETPDTIAGILNMRKLYLDPDHDLGNAIEFPSFVPETMNLLQLLKSLQRQKRGLAVVLDEFGGTAGLVTMEEILEEVVGELRHEWESETSEFEKLGEGRWQVKGTMRIEDFQEEYAEFGDVPGVDTMAGALVHELGIVPTAGESAVVNGVRLTAIAVDERRVRDVLVEVLKPGRRV